MELAERENLLETAAENEKIYVNGGRFVLENSDFLFAFRCGKSELQSPKNTAVEGNGEGFSNTIKFALWLYPETTEEVNCTFLGDNCGSRNEFIEKAIKFYIGYLKSANNINYLSPTITSSVDAVVHGAEQRINRNLFKIAVEFGKLAHTIAAANNVDEVRHINGVINFESAVKFQNE